MLAELAAVSCIPCLACTNVLHIQTRQPELSTHHGVIVSMGLRVKILPHAAPLLEACRPHIAYQKHPGACLLSVCFLDWLGVLLMAMYHCRCCWTDTKLPATMCWCWGLSSRQRSQSQTHTAATKVC